MNEEELAILRWLEANPHERALILWCAQHDPRVVQPIDYQPISAEGVQLLEENRAQVKRWLEAATFGPCGSCYHPIICWPDFTAADWPSMERHDCGGLSALREAEQATATGANPARSQPAPVALRTEPRTPKPQVAGSNPAGGTPPQQKRRLLV